MESPRGTGAAIDHSQNMSHPLGTAEEAAASTDRASLAIGVHDHDALETHLSPVSMAPALPKVHEILGRRNEIELSPVEQKLWRDTIAPLSKNRLDSLNPSEFLRQVLGGGFVDVKDGGAVYRAIRSLDGAYIRESSHVSVAPEFSVKLPNLGAILTGVSKDKATGQYHSWFQLEGSPQQKELKKKPEIDFDPKWVSPEELTGGYQNSRPSQVTFFDWLKHDFWDYPQYWWSGKKLNIGPYGSSPHTENSNRITIDPGTLSDH